MKERNTERKKDRERERERKRQSEKSEQDVKEKVVVVVYIVVVVLTFQKVWRSLVADAIDGDQRLAMTGSDRHLFAKLEMQ